MLRTVNNVNYSRKNTLLLRYLTMRKYVPGKRGAYDGMPMPQGVNSILNVKKELRSNFLYIDFFYLHYWA